MPEDFWFFLSHARRDALGEEYVPKFFNDLARRVGALAAFGSGVANEQIGFADFGDLEPGDQWPDHLSAALQSSRTMVCLYSPAYFASDYCGRELQVFLDRVAAGPGTGARDTVPPLILPVLWEGAERLPPSLPPEVARIHYASGSYGDEYERGGVRWLISLDANRDAYATFLERFAERVVEQAQAASMTGNAAVPPLDRVESAFTVRVAPGTEPSEFGPGTAVFVFVAAADGQARQVRNNVGAYGPTGGRDWRPWFPDAQRAVGVVAQSAASLENLFYETLPVDATLVDRLRSAEAAHAIVIIIVDPWSIQLDSYEPHMRAFDQNSFVNCGLLIPWNESDQETGEMVSRLGGLIRQTFSRCYVLNTAYIRDRIHSEDELQHALVAAIGDIRRRILQRAEVLRDIDASVPMPSIVGPSGVGR